MSQQVRVRFAPSPTGHLHIGGLRTALFNWIFARKHNGAFLIRVEDTDLVRSQDVFLHSQLASLKWADLMSDEPIIRQTECMAEYRAKIDTLLEQGKAYKCYCPSAPMATQEENYFKYDGKCRTGKSTTHGAASYVVRIKMPLDRAIIEFNDLIRGPISFDRNQFDDFIIARSDGSPIYNFVVVVDDIRMNISHVIRGEDHISNTPKQLIIYEALGSKPPLFAHLPLILGPTGARLSKRDAATAVSDYTKNGYLADALCNYLVRLGWSHGDQEIFSRQEMISLFSLEEVGKKGSIFDQQKLDWINALYIKLKTPQELIALIVQDVDKDFLERLKECADNLERVIGFFKERVKTLKELVEEINSLYKKDHIISADDREQWISPHVIDALRAFVVVLENTPLLTAENVLLGGKEIARNYSLKLVQLAQPLRLAITGKTEGPGIFELLTVLDKRESLERIKNFLATVYHKV